MNKEKKLKEKRTSRLVFPYGSDDWDFAFITIYYIEQIHIGKSIRESNTKHLEGLRINGSFQLCKDSQKAHIEQLNIEVNFIQSLQFIKTVDELSNLMVGKDGLKFTQAFLDWLRSKFTRFHSAKELEDFYLPFATGYIKLFNELYRGSELEDAIRNKV